MIRRMDTASVHKHHTTMHNAIEICLHNNVSRLILMPESPGAECRQYTTCIAILPASLNAQK